MGRIRVKRVYDAASPEDGVRILVDRLWPRGLSKDRAHVDKWIRDVAPSNTLRKWFGHDPSRWAEFRRKYVAELRTNRAATEPIRTLARRQDVTLLFGARDEAHNNAVVLAAAVRSRRTSSAPQARSRPKT